MQRLFTSPEVAPHAKIFKMNVQLPSMSVPNWMTILTVCEERRRRGRKGGMRAKRESTGG